MALPKNFRRAPGRNNWRGAAIPTLESMQELKSRGIKTIINLALDSTRKQRCPGGSYPKRPCEPIWAKQLGLRYVPMYLGSRPPSAARWAKVKSAIMDGNAFIHCTYGADRNGSCSRPDSGSRLNPAWTLKRSYGKQSNTDLSQSLTLDTAKDPTQIGVFVNGW